jgi:recombination protein RecA
MLKVKKTEKVKQTEIKKTPKPNKKTKLMSLVQKASVYKEREGEFRSTGVLELDLGLKCGGYRKGRIVELYGAEHSGKTLTALLGIIFDQKMYGTKSLFVDAEASFDLKWFETLGGNLDLLDIYNPYDVHDELYGEMIYDNIIDLINVNKYSFVVLDSLMGGALLSKKILKKKLDDKKGASPGGNAMLNKAFFQRAFGNLVKTDTTFLVTNHVVDKIGVMFGNPETTAGGKALKFFAEQRINMMQPKDKVENVGHISRTKIVKNKRGNSAGQTTQYYLSYEHGVDNFEKMKELLIEHGVIDKKSDLEITVKNYDEYKKQLLVIYNSIVLEGESDKHDIEEDDLVDDFED